MLEQCFTFGIYDIFKVGLRNGRGPISASSVLHHAAKLFDLQTNHASYKQRAAIFAFLQGK